MIDWSGREEKEKMEPTGEREEHVKKDIGTHNEIN